MKIAVDENGYYGEFGGAFIPELLHPNIQELKDNYLKISEEEEFQEAFKALLKDYVGRPTPLYFAKKLSQQYGAKIYLKREDLNHTGAHKILLLLVHCWDWNVPFSWARRTSTVSDLMLNG
jgi:tryptophan synthase beta chain